MAMGGVFVFCILTASCFDNSPTLIDHANYTGTIVFTAGSYQGADIYTCNADGTHLIQLTDTDYYEYYPRWSPNGRQILFSSNKNGNRDLFVMDRHGQNIVNLTGESNANEGMADWSPDGSQIVFACDRDGTDDIFIMNRDGTGIRKLVENPSRDFEPSWSPDGTTIAFTSERNGNQDIFVINVDGSGLRQLTDNENADKNPRWSPDGTKILYVPSYDREDIYMMNADGSEKVVVYSSSRNEVSPCWAPDGKSVAFQASLRIDGTGRDEVCIHSLSDEPNTLFKLTDGRGWATMPDWTAF